VQNCTLKAVYKVYQSRLQSKERGARGERHRPYSFEEEKKKLFFFFSLHNTKKDRETCASSNFKMRGRQRDDDDDARPLSPNCDRSGSFEAAQARQARREGLERFERGVQTPPAAAAHAARRLKAA
jgi:hypothetical protein